ANHEGTLRGGSASLCSRGAVVLEALRHGSADETRRFAEWVAPACKSYTLLLADPHRAFVVDHSPEGTQTFRLLPGCHVVTNARFRDPQDPKARRSLARMRVLAAQESAPTDAELAAFLADHEPAAPDATPLCIHPGVRSPGGKRFGTSSAAVIRVGPGGDVHRFLFAPGPPCREPFQDLTPTLQRSPKGLTPPHHEGGADAQTAHLRPK
ncbi:MAG: hypothetical protein IH608_11380, partial [Proteobacteria bacterium]|nr:hypothetical protein [Pseudomonadota bacterium]